MTERRPFPRRSSRGFTMVEVMVSLGLFVVLAVMGASLLVKTTSFTTESILRSDIMETAKVCQERLFDHLFSAKVLSLQGGGTGEPVLTFVVPVELPVGAGPQTDYLDSSGEVNWGAVEPAGPRADRPGDPHRLTATVVAAGSVTERESDMDLNHDQDLLDTVQLGSLVVRTTGGQETLLAPGRLVLGSADRSPIDIDGDGAPDPLLQVSGEAFTDSNQNGIHDEGESFVDSNGNQRWDGALNLNLLAFARDRAGQGHRFVYRTRVKLLNNP